MSTYLKQRTTEHKRTCFWVKMHRIALKILKSFKTLTCLPFYFHHCCWTPYLILCRRVPLTLLLLYLPWLPAPQSPPTQPATLNQGWGSSFHAFSKRSAVLQLGKCGDNCRSEQIARHKECRLELDLGSLRQSLTLVRRGKSACRNPVGNPSWGRLLYLVRIMCMTTLQTWHFPSHLWNRHPAK